MYRARSATPTARVRSAGPLDSSFAWAEALGLDPATLADIRVKLEVQIARDRELLAEQLAGFRRGALPADQLRPG